MSLESSIQHDCSSMFWSHTASAVISSSEINSASSAIVVVCSELGLQRIKGLLRTLKKGIASSIV